MALDHPLDPGVGDRLVGHVVPGTTAQEIGGKENHLEGIQLEVLDVSVVEDLGWVSGAEGGPFVCPLRVQVGDGGRC